MNEKKIQKAVKRIFDIVFSIFLLVTTLPLMVLAIIVIKKNSPEGSFIFKQNRSGFKCKIFTIYKLRTMSNDKDENGNYLKDEERLQAWGRLIRKTNLDEIPQMINILKGEMSLIGPRPVLPSDVNKFNSYQLRRQDALPGISGWEAVNEWKTPTWDKKFEYDIFYVDNFSLWLDIKIFFKTIFVILFSKRPDESYRPGRFDGE